MNYQEIIRENLTETKQDFDVLILRFTRKENNYSIPNHVTHSVHQEFGKDLGNQILSKFKNNAKDGRRSLVVRFNKNAIQFNLDSDGKSSERFYNWGTLDITFSTAQVQARIKKSFEHRMNLIQIEEEILQESRSQKIEGKG